MDKLLTSVSRVEAENAIRTLLRFIGEDPDRAGLRDTPKRVCEAWTNDWASGYGLNCATALFDTQGEFKTFTDDASEPYPSEMIIQQDISFSSTCEHHLAPFYGTVDIGYIPKNGKLVGLSKLSRVVGIFAKQLQMQERLTTQIADFLKQHLSPHVAVIVRAEHMCMRSRGVYQQHAVTVTSALRGNFFDEHETRAELYSLVRKA